MEIICKAFGTTSDGQQVDCYTLIDGPYQASVLTYGGILQSFCVPDRAGKQTDIVLGFDTVEAYEKQTCYIGALLGRCANRIAGGRFELNGQTYELNCNDNGINHLHGGNIGFDRRIWSAKTDDDGLKLWYNSPAGEEHYPAALSAEVTYRLSEGALTITYVAESDGDTICNLSNHSYFNLAGHASGEVGRQKVCIHADRYTPIGETSAPNGEIASVENTPMDLREPAAIGAGWDDSFSQIALGAGYDHNYIIEGQGMRPFAQAFCEESGIVLSVISDMPGVQFYSGNYLDETLPLGKNGAKYGRRHGFCLETQFWPNATAFSHFPQPVLRKGDTYHKCTKFQVSHLE